VAWPDIPTDFDEWAPPKKRTTRGWMAKLRWGENHIFVKSGKFM
jgi:hypothetical protein